MLFAACVMVVLIFRISANMQAAYGLSITITMLMTTVLMTVYLKNAHLPKALLILFTGTYLVIEGSFLAANMMKFIHGGWFTVLLAGIIAYVMFIWFRARRIKNRFTRFVRIADYYEQLEDLSVDQSVPKYSTNLVYLTRADKVSDVESKVMYSIFNKSPKRADTYWLLHVHICDDPHTLEYSVDELIPGVLIRVEFRLGFKVQPRINLYFTEVLQELKKSREADLVSHHPSLRKHDVAADFRFIIIHRVQNYDFDFPGMEQYIMDHYTFLSRLALSDVKAYGLDSSNVMTEVVPLVIQNNCKPVLKRIRHA
jgi:KUP system potassium uptake protein